MKPEYRSFTLISQYKTDIPFPRDAKFALKVICKFFEKKYHTSTDLDKNQSQLEAYGYSFDEDIVDFTKSGSVSVLSKDQITELNDISIHEPLNTHKHGKEYHHCVAEIGYKANLDYSSTNTIMRKLFLNGVRCDAKILRLETRNLYAFIINNERRLIEDVRDAMADESLQLSPLHPVATGRNTARNAGAPSDASRRRTLPDGGAASNIKRRESLEFQGFWDSRAGVGGRFHSPPPKSISNILQRRILWTTN